MSSKRIQPGLKADTEILVGSRDTAHHVGSGKIKVLATPVMIMLLEEAALNAVEELIEVDGRKLTFRVWAEDEIEPIAAGTHERIVVEVERFDRRTRAKAGGTADT
jgi:fluoroacetyl-CoA thioesterase